MFQGVVLSHTRSLWRVSAGGGGTFSKCSLLGIVSGIIVDIRLVFGHRVWTGAFQTQSAYPFKTRRATNRLPDIPAWASGCECFDLEKHGHGLARRCLLHDWYKYYISQIIPKAPIFAEAYASQVRDQGTRKTSF